MKSRKSKFRQMKAICVSTVMLCLIFLSSCNNENKLLGHWKCDSTGTITSTYKGKTQNAPVTEFYKSFKTLPLEIEFLDDGIMIQHVRKTNESYKKEKAFYYPNYQGNKNKIMVRTNDGDDENIITVKSITDNEMKIAWDSVEDDMVLDLVMNHRQGGS